MLRSIHWVSLYNDWDAGTRRIISVVRPEVEDGSLTTRQEDVYSEEEIVHSCLPMSLTSMIDGMKRERRIDDFSLIRGDFGKEKYTRKAIDRLTLTQREKLFTADPEMANWWRGKSVTDGTWPSFRIRGGIWVSKNQIDQIPNEDRADFWKIPALLEWYVEGLRF